MFFLCRILLRVRLLAYIKNDIIGEFGMKALSVGNVSEILLPYAAPDCDPPAPWWDEEADKSLLIGTFKHGYDRYIAMRQDPALCFLSRCGPLHGFIEENIPDPEDGKTPEDEDAENSILPEKGDQEGESETILSQDSVDSSKAEADSVEETKNDSENDAKTSENENEKDETKDEMDVDASAVNSVESSVPDESVLASEMSQIEGGDEISRFLPFPPVAELNNRLRRLLTSYQKNFKKEEAKNAQNARNKLRMEKMEKIEASIREKESKKKEHAQK